MNHTQRPGRAEAAAVVLSREADASEQPSAGRLRLRGVLQAAIASAIAGMVFYLGSRTFAMVILGIASLVLLTALTSPAGAFAALDRAFAALGRRLSRLVTWLALVPVFYLFFLPFGQLFRRGRRDQLQRYFESDAATYWEPVDGTRGPSDLPERQY